MTVACEIPCHAIYHAMQYSKQYTMPCNGTKLTCHVCPRRLRTRRRVPDFHARTLAPKVCKSLASMSQSGDTGAAAPAGPSFCMEAGRRLKECSATTPDHWTTSRRLAAIGWPTAASFASLLTRCRSGISPARTVRPRPASALATIIATCRIV